MANVQRPARNPAFYGLPFVLAFALSVIMLITDKNLQTDFGTLSSGYYFHWYVVLGTAVADVLGAALVFLLRSRMAVKAGVAGSGLLVALFAGDVLTYSQVGYSSASAFANYLFGITYGGGNIRYLYDVVLAVYVGTFLWGVVYLVLTRPSRAPPRPARSEVPSAP